MFTITVTKFNGEGIETMLYTDVKSIILLRTI